MTSPGALQGLRVLEIGSLIGGPFCGTLMAEFGAEVIKVEDPRNGDPARHLGQALDGTSAYFASLCRNKKCITLDLRSAEGHALLKRLASMSDVVIENFRPGTLSEWGLDYASLSTVNPRLVMAHVSGFGQTGPYRDRLAFDRVATAFAGQDHLTGFPENAPTRPAGALADYITALFCTIGVMFALRHRDAGGGMGQEIDVGLYEGLFRIINQVEEYDWCGIVRERMGNANPHIAPAQTFVTRDQQWVVINAGTDNVFARLAELMGRPDLVRDPRFEAHSTRARNGAAIHAIVGEWVATLDLADVLARLETAAVPATKVNNVADLCRDPHVRARENVIEAALASGRRYLATGIVPKLSLTPGRIDAVAPPMGAHNDEVYRGLLGLAESDCRQLKARRVI